MALKSVCIVILCCVLCAYDKGYQDHRCAEELAS